MDRRSVTRRFVSQHCLRYQDSTAEMASLPQSLDALAMGSKTKGREPCGDSRSGCTQQRLSKSI